MIIELHVRNGSNSGQQKIFCLKIDWPMCQKHGNRYRQNGQHKDLQKV